MWVEGSYAYLAGVANDAGLIIVDVSDPSKPLRLGSYKDKTCSESVTVAGSYAYLAHGDRGIEIIDISTPKEPFVKQHINAAGAARGVQIVGTHAYLANGYTGLRILDVSNQSAVKEIASLPTYRAVGVDVSGSYAYVGDGEWVRVFDVS